jgi:hypothetical protein
VLLSRSLNPHVIRPRTGKVKNLVMVYDYDYDDDDDDDDVEDVDIKQ